MMANKIFIQSFYSFSFAALLFTACTPAKTENASNDMTGTNPLVQPWGTLHNGVPPFDKVKVADFVPAEEIAIAQQRNEINVIASSADAPTFANTVEAL